MARKPLQPAKPKEQSQRQQSGGSLREERIGGDHPAQWNHNWGDFSPTKWERNLSLGLAVIMFVGGGVGAFYFSLNKPSLPINTLAEVQSAERWIRVLLTIMWVGFGVTSVLAMILLSSIIGVIEKFLARRNLSLKKNHRLDSNHNRIKADT